MNCHVQWTGLTGNCRRMFLKVFVIARSRLKNRITFFTINFVYILVFIHGMIENLKHINILPNSNSKNQSEIMNFHVVVMFNLVLCYKSTMRTRKHLFHRFWFLFDGFPRDRFNQNGVRVGYYSKVSCLSNGIEIFLDGCDDYLSIDGFIIIYW